MFGSPTLWVSGRWVSCLSDLLFSRFPKDIHIFRAPGSWNWQNRELRNTYRGVDLKKTRFVPGRFSCTNSPPSCTWRKVVDGYNRNIFSLPKNHIRISRAFATWPIVRNTGCDPLFFTTPLILSKPDRLNGSKGQEFNLEFRNSVFWFPGIIKWKRPKKH